MTPSSQNRLCTGIIQGVSKILMSRCLGPSPRINDFTGMGYSLGIEISFFF